MAIVVTAEMIANFENAERAAEEFKQGLQKKIAEATGKSGKELQKFTDGFAKDLGKLQQKLSLESKVGAFGDLKDSFEKAAVGLGGLKKETAEAAVKALDLAEKGAMIGKEFGALPALALGGVGLVIGVFNSIEEKAKKAKEEVTKVVFETDALVRKLKMELGGFQMTPVQEGLEKVQKQLNETNERGRGLSNTLSNIDSFGFFRIGPQFDYFKGKQLENTIQAAQLRIELQRLNEVGFQQLQKQLGGLSDEIDKILGRFYPVFETAAQAGKAVKGLRGELELLQGQIETTRSIMKGEDETSERYTKLASQVKAAEKEVSRLSGALANAESQQKSLASAEESRAEKASEKREKAVDDAAKLAEQEYRARLKQDQFFFHLRLEMENEEAARKQRLAEAFFNAELELRHHQEEMLRQSLDVRAQMERDHYALRLQALDTFSAKWEERLQPFADAAMQVFNQVGENIENNQKLLAGLPAAAARGMSGLFKQLGKKAFGEGISYSADAIAAFFSPLLGGPPAAAGFAQAAGLKFATAAAFGAAGAVSGRLANAGGRGSGAGGGRSAGGGRESGGLGRASRERAAVPINITVNFESLVPPSPDDYRRAGEVIANSLGAAWRSGTRSGGLSSAGARVLEALPR